MTFGSDPVRWWLFENAVPTIASPVPPPEWSGWEARYENDCERGKRTCRRLSELLPEYAPTLLDLRTRADDWIRRLGYPVYNDLYLHGGGLHVTAPGGVLATHLDYALHPDGVGIRALNVIAFVHPKWEAAWGGELYLADPLGNVVRSFEPRPGRVVAFEVSDCSYHGVQPTAPVAKERVSLAVYYLAHAGVKRACDLPIPTRRRAVFLPSRAGNPSKPPGRL